MLGSNPKRHIKMYYTQFRIAANALYTTKRNVAHSHIFVGHRHWSIQFLYVRFIRHLRTKLKLDEHKHSAICHASVCVSGRGRKEDAAYQRIYVRAGEKESELVCIYEIWRRRFVQILFSLLVVCIACNTTILSV